MADLKTGAEKLDGLIDPVIKPILKAARIPGAAIAIVKGGKTIFAKGYGQRDVAAKLPLTAQTLYPIASTTKAINATLIGMLVDEGKLAWDVPVQNYLPWFRLHDPLISTQVTIRDLIIMRTGLPRHDWTWFGNVGSRGELVRRIRYLELSAGFRERFQYNNLTVNVAAHAAEAVTGQTWEELARQRILEPLGMTSTVFSRPSSGNVTASYHENSQRELLLSTLINGDVTAPSGGAIYSTVEDMTRWLAFNLNGGKVGDRELIKAQTLKEIHTPQMILGPNDTAAPVPSAPYAMGWFVSQYSGHPRVSHGGYHHDVNSEAAFFPKDNLGIVSFINFGPTRLARFMGERAFDALHGLQPAATMEEKNKQYEDSVQTVRQRIESASRVANTSPSHPLEDYAGTYSHPGYGAIEIRRDGKKLTFVLNQLSLELEHWHYDAWGFVDVGRFPIHVEHAFDRASRLLFETNADGRIAAVTVHLEPAVPPIRFNKQA